MAVNRLLDFIAKYESKGDYNIVWGGIRKADKPPKPLTSMTVQEVLDWQDSIDAKYMSEASGRYQIMEDTLRDLVKQGKCRPSDIYNEKTQDKLGVALLDRRGLSRYKRGEISTEKFCNSVAREWASMPVVSGPKKGRSFYAGDGLNKAHADVGEFMSAAQAAKSGPMPKVSKPGIGNSSTIKAAAGLVAGTGAGIMYVSPSLPQIERVVGFLVFALVVIGSSYIIKERRKKPA